MSAAWAYHHASELGTGGPVTRPVVPAAAAPGRAASVWRPPSCRTFGPWPGDAALRSAIADALEPDAGGRRPFPSAGALYGSWLLAVGPRAGRALATREGRDWVAAPGPVASPRAIGFAQVSGPHALVVLAGAPGRYLERYGERGYRYLLLEAGHLAQELLRTVAAHGLACVPLGAFDDRTANRLLQRLDPGSLALYALAAGVAG